jgi:hypothetical protein
MKMAIFQTALRMIYPVCCLLCGEIVEIDFGLCGSFWGKMPFLASLCCDSYRMHLIGSSFSSVEACDEGLEQAPLGKMPLITALKGIRTQNCARAQAWR